MLPGLVVLLGTLLVCAWFVVELGGVLHAQQRVNDLAAQAARTGGQQIALATTTSGTQTLTVDPWTARAAARSYLTTAGVAGDVVVDQTRITVTVTDTYTSPLFGSDISAWQVTGTSTARLVRTLAGTEQP